MEDPFNRHLDNPSPPGVFLFVCEEFCQRCESCKQLFPGFSEGDCQTFTAEPDGECMSSCPGGLVERQLTSLKRPINEFSCCDLDFLF